MLENLTVIKLASAMARHAAARHSVISQNVANADTPGYRARDIQSFAATVNEGFTQRATRPGHLTVNGAGGLPGPRMLEDLPAAPNGNTVNLEDQSLRAVQTQGQHGLALAIYSKTVDILRIGLGRNR